MNEYKQIAIAVVLAILGSRGATAAEDHLTADVADNAEHIAEDGEHIDDNADHIEEDEKAIAELTVRVHDLERDFQALNRDHDKLEGRFNMLLSDID